MDDPGRPEDLPPDHELLDEFEPAVPDASRVEADEALAGRGGRRGADPGAG